MENLKQAETINSPISPKEIKGNFHNSLNGLRDKYTHVIENTKEKLKSLDKSPALESDVIRLVRNNNKKPISDEQIKNNFYDSINDLRDKYTRVIENAEKELELLDRFPALESDVVKLVRNYNRQSGGKNEAAVNPNKVIKKSSFLKRIFRLN